MVVYFNILSSRSQCESRYGEKPQSLFDRLLQVGQSIEDIKVNWIVIGWKNFVQFIDDFLLNIFVHGEEEKCGRNNYGSGVLCLFFRKIKIK